MEFNVDGPILNLPGEVLEPLCLSLSVSNPLAHDWKRLAGYIRLPFHVIALIDQTQSLKAFKLIELWDRGIKKNPGTVRKLIVALTECDFPSYVRDLRSQLQGLVDFTEIDAFIAKLRLHPNGVQGALFPILQVSDIVWDHVIQKKFILSPDDIECDQDPLPYPDPKPTVIKNTIYVSYFSASHCGTYKRQVENLVKTLRNYGHTVWYSKGFKMRLSTWKQRHIGAADSIIVVFNQDYRFACERHCSDNTVPSCVAVDIPCIERVAFFEGGASRIIPVTVDKCKKHCDQASIFNLPAWLTCSVSPIPFPSKQRDLLRCVQRVREYTAPEPRELIEVKPKPLDYEEVMRQHQAKLEAERNHKQ